MNEKLEFVIFGQFNIFLDGKTLLNTKNSHSKMMDVLRYLFMNEGRFLAPEDIMGSMGWKYDYEDEKNIIKMYIHRLRKFFQGANALSADISAYIKIVNSSNRYGLELSQQCQSQKRDFERAYRDINLEYSSQRLKEIYMYMADMYAGNFMNADLESPSWMQHYQTQYKNMYLHATEKYLDALEKDKKYTEMIEVCERFLSIYELDEGMNINYMKACLKAGRVHDALQQYHFVQGEYRGRGIEESDQMRQILTKLQSSQYIDVIEPVEYSRIVGNVRKEMEKLLKSGNKWYSLCYIKIQYSHTIEEADKYEIQRLLRGVLSKALRSRDMFVVPKPEVAIAVLYGPKHDYYEKIKARIKEYLAQESVENKFSLNMEIYELNEI